jgi:hypothetical protein
LGPPGARCSTSSGLTNVTIANVLVTGVQLNSNNFKKAEKPKNTTNLSNLLMIQPIDL